jgi:hypothetical protein
MFQWSMVSIVLRCRALNVRYQASEEFVQDLVRPYADPSLGPVLQLGCGDAPVPEHLHRAGGAGPT